MSKRLHIIAVKIKKLINFTISCEIRYAYRMYDNFKRFYLFSYFRYYAIVLQKKKNYFI